MLLGCQKLEKLFYKNCSQFWISTNYLSLNIYNHVRHCRSSSREKPSPLQNINELSKNKILRCRLLWQPNVSPWNELLPFQVTSLAEKNLLNFSTKIFILGFAFSGFDYLWTKNSSILGEKCLKQGFSRVNKVIFILPLNSFKHHRLWLLLWF